MKRALLLVAICLAGLQACDNTGQEQLTPIETEILEIEGLIASQAETGFDEQELLSDIKAGTLTKTSYFHYKNGEIVQSSYDNYIGSQWDAPYVFLDDGTCRHCCGFPDPINPYKYINYAWQYNQETKSIETRLYNFEDKFSAKVLYYNKESGKLILEGNFCDCIGVYGGGEPVADYSRMTFHIDLDPETREEYLNKYCNEYK